MTTNRPLQKRPTTEEDKMPRAGQQMSSEDVSLGTWGCQSGNRCAVGMKIMKAAEVSLTFSWDKEPSPNDLEEWSFTVFGVALDRGDGAGISVPGGR
jgi:hypothetical protein